MDLADGLKNWAGFLARIRRFFDERGFLEVTTPMLVEAGAFEASIDTLKVTHAGGHCELPTSPELQMKALLAETALPIYQICECFREDPPTPIHTKEFTMLEFYRVNGTANDVETDTRALLQSLCQGVLSFEQVTVRALFLKYLDLDLYQLQDEASFRNAIRHHGLVSGGWDLEQDAWCDLFFRLYVQYVEPKLDPNVCTVVSGFPSAVSPLSSLDDEFASDRFEVYWKGIELCNGCSELTDAEKLRGRYEEESKLRSLSGRAPHPYPGSFLSAADKGIPPSAGVAIGLNRLYYCIFGEKAPILGLW